MTECMPVSSLAPEYHKSAQEATPADLLRMRSAGKFEPVVVMIEDLEQPCSGKPPPHDKKGVGQVCTRGSVMMMGYFKNPEKTHEVLPEDNFFRTGDVGKIDENGFLHILGRVKEIIPTHGGFNCCPRDIEEVLYENPKVGQAAVVGVHHPCGAGEAIIAWVAAKVHVQVSPKDIRCHCEESGLPSWQMPDAIHVTSEPLPTTGGKIARQVLQHPDFRKAALSKDVAFVCQQLAFPSRNPVDHSLPSKDDFQKEHFEADARSLFQRMQSLQQVDVNSKALGPLGASELEAIFGDGAEFILTAVSAVSPPGGARWSKCETGGPGVSEHGTQAISRQVRLEKWLKILMSMDSDMLAAFILEANSLLSSDS
eukprot:TRINITY_DN86994_c0_g1_i1.p1 TRINITY_DN86994_c0_g1~~TRINITY_DN86994_c0_g1_i1.p1  ORF type:complete len:388 (+),score=90.23 TRINITY_DN86994_c0_g1_i1:62-1165(+)